MLAAPGHDAAPMELCPRANFRSVKGDLRRPACLFFALHAVPATGCAAASCAGSEYDAAPARSNTSDGEAGIPRPVPWASPMVSRPPIFADSSCLAHLPEAPDFQTFPDFATAAGPLRVIWRVEPLSDRADEQLPQYRIPRGEVHLRLEANGVVRDTDLGAFDGQPHGKELSICRLVAPVGPTC